MRVLAQFLSTHREAILTKSRAKVSSRTAPRPTTIEMEAGLPRFLDQLVATLAAELSTGERPTGKQIGLAAAARGHVLHDIGFTASQVIHDYGDICQAITELAVELNASITPSEFRTVNGCLDDAMAEAISEFGHQRELSIEGDQAERRSHLAHDLRNLLNVSMLALHGLRDGTIGVGGSTGTMLGVSLKRMGDVLDHALAAEAASAPTAPDGTHPIAPRVDTGATDS